MSHLRDDATPYSFCIVGMVYCLDELINTRVICSRLQEIKKIDSEAQKQNQKAK